MTEQAEHGEKLQAKGNGKNVPFAGEMDSIVASTVTEQAGFEQVEDSKDKLINLLKRASFLEN